MSNKRYYKTTNKNHATVLSYVGFKYMKFNDNAEVEYVFEETVELAQALIDLKQFKTKYRI